jgi:hypothetical protein
LFAFSRGPTFYDRHNDLFGLVDLGRIEPCMACRISGTPLSASRQASATRRQPPETQAATIRQSLLPQATPIVRLLLACTVIGQSQDRFEPRQLKGAETLVQPRKAL